MKQLALVFLPVVLGAVLANQATPWLYRTLPSDFSRTRLILDVLQGKTDTPPAGLVFGSSVTMAGVDAGVLEKVTGIAPFYNLSSTGQSFAESRLFYELIDSSVTRVVVQLIRAEDLMQAGGPGVVKYRNARLLGLRPGPETYRINDDETFVSFFDEPAYRVNNGARTVVRAAIDNSIRSLARRDLDLARLNTELKHPNTYTTRLPEKKYRQLIDRYNPEPPLTTLTIGEKSKDRFLKAAEFFTKRGIDYHLVLQPVNPDLTGYTPEFFAELDRRQSDLARLRIIDLTRVLQAEDFVDHWHPAPTGAEKLSRALASAILNTDDAL